MSTSLGFIAVCLSAWSRMQSCVYCFYRSLRVVLQYSLSDIGMLISLWGGSDLVDSFKIQVYFAEYSLFYGALLQKRSIFEGSLLIVAPSYLILVSASCLLVGATRYEHMYQHAHQHVYQHPNEDVYQDKHQHHVY